MQVGGPLGAYFPESLLDTPLDYEAFAAAKGLLGHGGVVVFDDTVDLARQARFAFEFCAQESCGKCTPCRIGAVRGVETMDKIIADQERAKNLVLLDDLCQLMTDASLCAMGGLTPVPVHERADPFPRGFRPRARARRGRVTGDGDAERQAPCCARSSPLAGEGGRPKGDGVGSAVRRGSDLDPTSVALRAPPSPRRGGKERPGFTPIRKGRGHGPDPGTRHRHADPRRRTSTVTLTIDGQTSPCRAAPP